MIDPDCPACKTIKSPCGDHKDSRNIIICTHAPLYVHHVRGGYCQDCEKYVNCEQHLQKCLLRRYNHCREL